MNKKQSLAIFIVFVIILSLFGTSMSEVHAKSKTVVQRILRR